MRNRTLPLRRLGLALLVASTVFPPSAGAQSSCDLGFALTHGGVAEADINGDGLTCEFNTVDSITGVWTTIALDNVPPDISAPDQCPDHFVSTPWPCGVTPDRNMDCKVCMKATQGHVFFVDDNAKSGSCVSNPTKCKAPDKCTVAACDATTGLCVFTPVVCTASDQCHMRSRHGPVLQSTGTGRHRLQRRQPVHIRQLPGRYVHALYRKGLSGGLRSCDRHVHVVTRCWSTRSTQSPRAACIRLPAGTSRLRLTPVVASPARATS